MANRASTGRKAEPGESQRGVAFRAQMRNLARTLHKQQMEAKAKLSREEPTGGPAGGARSNDAASSPSLPSPASKPSAGSDGTVTGTGPKI